MGMLPVVISRVDRSHDHHLPRYARPGDAGLDLVANEECVLEPGGGRALVGTGFAVAIPDGYAGFVLPRSGLAVKHGLTLMNTPGLIDSGYRGELKIALLNTDPTEAFVVEKGLRIAQLVLAPVAQVVLTEVDDLPLDLREGARGVGGFGHSGVVVTEACDE